MHNTYLCCGIGEYSAYSLGKAIKIVRAGNEYILHTTSLYVSEYTHPEGAALALSDPHAKHLFKTVLLESYAQIDGLVDYLTVVANLEYNAVHPYNEIERVERAVLPLKGGLVHLVRDD